MSLPNFLIIGAAKSGTTALTKFLQQHPQIHIPYKEPDFFSGWNTRVKFNRLTKETAEIARHVGRCCGSLEQYQSLFANSGNARAIGEASVSYLLDEHAPAFMRQVLPDVRLIALLRQPAERAYSHFCMNRRMQTEPERDFIKALAEDPHRLRRNMMPSFSYLHAGHYPAQLARYRAVFPPEQMRIYLHEDWKHKPNEVWTDLMNFLAVDPSFTPDFSRTYGENRTQGRIWPLILLARPLARTLFPRKVRASIHNRLHRICTRPEKLDPALRHELTLRHFHQDILELQDILHRDLSHWL